MKKNILLLLCCLLNINRYLVADVDSGFFIIERDGILHHFAKVNVEWIDNFLKNNFRDWEHDTFAIFQQVKDPNGIAIDLGAWLGTTAIWLSKNFKHVIAVEADKKSVYYLEKNLCASHCDNVIVCPYAVLDRDKLVNFGPRLTMGHGDALNGSTSFIKDEIDSASDYTVMGLTFETITNNYVEKNMNAFSDHISFIKCDIEGGEEMILHDVLEFALTHKSKVWMSFHIPWWTHKTIQEFEEKFSKFKVNIHPANVCEYLEKNPFGSILFEPL